jgi:hypothetical protein
MLLSKKQAKEKAKKLIERVSQDTCYETIKRDLSNIYRVENLSLIEEWHLKRIMKKVTDEQEKILIEWYTGETTVAALLDYSQEVRERWLWELYNINVIQYADKYAKFTKGKSRIFLSCEAYQRLNEDIKFTRENAHMF